MLIQAIDLQVGDITPTQSVVTSAVFPYGAVDESRISVQVERPDGRLVELIFWETDQIEVDR